MLFLFRLVESVRIAESGIDAVEGSCRETKGPATERQCAHIAVCAD
jgi:hypothetical protein